MNIKEIIDFCELAMLVFGVASLPIGLLMSMVKRLIKTLTNKKLHIE